MIPFTPTSTLKQDSFPKHKLPTFRQILTKFIELAQHPFQTSPTTKTNPRLQTTSSRCLKNGVSLTPPFTRHRSFSDVKTTTYGQSSRSSYPHAIHDRHAGYAAHYQHLLTLFSLILQMIPMIPQPLLPPLPSRRQTDASSMTKKTTQMLSTPGMLLRILR